MREVEPAVRGKEATRQRIVEAAIETFAERGYHDTGVDDIVKAAGASKGAFYFHFPSKEGIFFSLIDGLASTLARSVSEGIAGQTGGVNRVDAALKAVFHTASRHRKLAKILLVGSIGLGRAFDQRLMDLHGRFAQLIKAHLDEVVASGDIPAIDTEVAAYAWLGAVNEVVVHWLYTGQPPELGSALPHVRALLLRSIDVEVDSAPDA